MESKGELAPPPPARESNDRNRVARAACSTRYRCDEEQRSRRGTHSLSRSVCGSIAANNRREVWPINPITNGLFNIYRPINIGKPNSRAMIDTRPLARGRFAREARQWMNSRDEIARFSPLHARTCTSSFFTETITKTCDASKGQNTWRWRDATLREILVE